MKIKAKRDFQYENDLLKEGEVHELPDSMAKQAIKKDYAEGAEEEEAPKIGEAEEEKKEEMPKIEKPEKEKDAEGVEEAGERENPWREMKKELDEEPELPGRWNPPRDMVKSGEVSAGDVDDLLGVVKRMDVHRKFDTPMAVVETPRGEEVTVFRQKAIEDLFEAMGPGDRVAIRFTGLERSANGYEYLTYRYELRGSGGEKKLSR